MRLHKLIFQVPSQVGKPVWTLSDVVTKVCQSAAAPAGLQVSKFLPETACSLGFAQVKSGFQSTLK